MGLCGGSRSQSGRACAWCATPWKPTWGSLDTRPFWSLQRHFLPPCAPAFTAQQHVRCPQGCFLTPFLCSRCPWASNAFPNQVPCSFQNLLSRKPSEALLSPVRLGELNSPPCTSPSLHLHRDLSGGLFSHQPGGCWAYAGPVSVALSSSEWGRCRPAGAAGEGLSVTVHPCVRKMCLPRPSGKGEGSKGPPLDPTVANGSRGAWCVEQ